MSAYSVFLRSESMGAMAVRACMVPSVGMGPAANKVHLDTMRWIR